MKQLSKTIDKNGEGSVKLMATEEEDMWHLYNLISVGNVVKASTIRKVQRQTATGSSESERMKISLTIEIVDVEFDSQGLQLRLKGKNVGENEHVKVGAFHTIEIELHRSFTLYKPKWDAIDLERLATACNPTAEADVAIVVMQEGLAHICVLTRSISTVVARIETSIPRKGVSGVLNRDKAMEKFFDTIYRSMNEKLKLEQLKMIIIASPGFVKDEFFKYMNEEAVRRDNKVLMKAKQKTIVAHCSSGHKHAIHEVLSNPALASRLADTKAVAEIRALNQFFETMNVNPDRVCYGPQHVEYAANMGAVQTLLLTDSLFRNVDVKTREKYVELVDIVKSAGGEVHIFSAMHVTGEQLGEMTGIAAMLRFPLPELFDMEFDDVNKDEEQADDGTY
mmetsp:Transcript_7038/g.21438  ORF Transcript_7038/g.21438 Transcript_7038/m.21438 type:complete len:394 (-) Transcript_7038:513-1694(-)|eukprot:CAMPEP_0198723382 /NCGR_PEP_ID=MMETSP1475-20131203/899_1 /TAXON_ID= ORGANISM="Unidentified sp., Strain CCMP1999" /NCGR_SAMPLE_ID=MMETSP1475 /ASSEMBLY_ACC=CAM_ASM_001111 /LENGTH=393 /DNA_ID=CAMNT_0044484489 /DNA_START=157 /DNA_END=1338 /DNA_ORIENTATION=+